MCKTFLFASLLPAEILCNIVAFSDNTNCLSVNKLFHHEFSRKMKTRNEKRGLSLLERGSFYGIVLAKNAEKGILSAHAAHSGNKRLLKKVMMYDKKNCYAGSQENALYCASFSGNRKLALWVKKRFRANCVSGFHGALEGGHTKDALRWWKKMEKKVGEKEKSGFLGHAIVRALKSDNKEAVPVLLKMGGVPTPDSFDICAKSRDLQTFKLLLGADKMQRRERALLAAIKTKDQEFVFACFRAGIQTENIHIEFAQKTDRMMSLLIS
ncbi:hypothetical protein A9K97_gp286 [Tokyovirus A1]|uniref:hypothetical protein n=1 Tax=Tokyovirus A1 TaxID=1826170 RepID=UPI0007A96FDB|nr:hypothetical protein A9K97_gp286 [Tokyovirus A1]BAU80065.1 conserved hypothetical protein [Tokyovirus A1]